MILAYGMEPFLFELGNILSPNFEESVSSMALNRIDVCQIYNNS